MPTFKVKNLTVSLGEAERERTELYPCPAPSIGCPGASIACNWPTIHCAWPTIHCRFPTIVTCWTGTITCLTNTCGIFSPDPCGPVTDPCGPAWSTLPPTTFKDITPVIKGVADPRVLELLRGQLEEAIGAVKERGIEVETGERPRTMEEADKLEKELKAALDEVREMKKGLKKG
jgi:hypothetical protein